MVEMKAGRDNRMKSALVDVPVKINIWIRSECQRKQFDVIKKARPSVLFLQSDGGRNEKEWAAIRQNRALYDNEIDWECTVYRVYEDHNLGMYTMGKKVSDVIWAHTDRCVFLEDDDIPSVCFFQFCAELLEKYKDDLRVCYITGVNYKGIYDEPGADYFFAGVGCIHGLATWKRVMKQRSLEYWNDKYVLDRTIRMTQKFNPGFVKQINNFGEKGIHNNHVAGAEFYMRFFLYAQNQLVIVPSKNLISNIGVGEGNAHSANDLKLLPRAIQKLFYCKTYEMEFPLRHPRYCVRDVAYDESAKRKLGTDHPLIWFFRRCERLLRCIYYGDWEKIRSVIKRLFVKEVER